MGFWRRSRSCEKGNTLTEFAGVCCVYVVLTTGFVDMNFLMDERTEMVESARAAARVAASFVPDDDSESAEKDICRVALNIARDTLELSNLNPANFEISVGPAKIFTFESARAVQVEITKIKSTRLLPGGLFSEHQAGASARSTFMFEREQSLSQKCVSTGLG